MSRVQPDLPILSLDQVSTDNDVRFCSVVDHEDCFKFSSVLLLLNPEAKKAFYKTKRSRLSVVSFILILSILTVYILYSKCIAFANFPSAMTTISLTLGLCSILSSWLLCGVYTFGVCRNMLCTHFVKNYLQYVESIWHFTSCISFGLNLIAVGYNGHCLSTFDVKLPGFGCNYSSPHQMPEDIMIVSVLIPLLLALIVKTIHWEVMCLSFVMNVLCALFTILYYDLTLSLSSFCVTTIVTGIIMFDYRRQTLMDFFKMQRQQHLLDEHERNSKETGATELRHMIGNVAHDLKTPLSAFVSGIDLILTVLKAIDLLVDKSQSQSPGCSSWMDPMTAKLSEIVDTVQNMKNVNEFMLMTINRCIDYTKASQGLKLVPRMETINFAEAINLPLRCMKNLQNDTDTEIRIRTVPKDISTNIITDKQWLQENILCLLSNAVKYSAGGLVDVEVSLMTPIESYRLMQRMYVAQATESSVSPNSPRSLRNVPPMIRIDVDDTGIGIAPTAMKSLFQPFKQAQRLAGGTGLGLYSLAKRVEALGGLYGVSNRRDGVRGSLFWFTIPYRPDNSSVSHGSTSTGQSDEMTQPPLIVIPQASDLTTSLIHVEREITPLNILIVDDSPAILKMSGRMLKQVGHTVTTAVNGADALVKIKEEHTTMPHGTFYFDVVLMDLQMPVMDGLEATSRIRAAEKELLHTLGEESSSHMNGVVAHQLIIGVSANSDNDTMKAAFAAGIDAFIAKPFTLQSFHDTYSTVYKKLCN